MRNILHSDMNNFYASVECMLNPSLKGKPVAVCGSVEERHSIVLAKNYPAKAHGVQTGEAVWQAQQKCPGLVIVPPHFDEYIKYSIASQTEKLAIIYFGLSDDPNVNTTVGETVQVGKNKFTCVTVVDGSGGSHQVFVNVVSGECVSRSTFEELLGETDNQDSEEDTEAEQPIVN